jgi:ribonuclease BN (tRNA processing enzyme)
VDKLLGPEGAFFVDWNSRIEHPASHDCHTQRGGELPRPAPAIEAHDIGPGEVAETDAWVATAERVHHVEPTMTSMAFRFETDRGAIVFAGDCGDCKELRRFARGANTLVIACTHFGSPPSTPAIVDVITGTPEVAEIASEAEVRRVVLTHVSPNFSRPGVKEKAVREVARGFGGEIVFPNELTTVDLTK